MQSKSEAVLNLRDFLKLPSDTYARNLKKWDENHQIIFSKDNEDLYFYTRSYFDRLREPKSYTKQGRPTHKASYSSEKNPENCKSNRVPKVINPKTTASIPVTWSLEPPKIRQTLKLVSQLEKSSNKSSADNFRKSKLESKWDDTHSVLFSEINERLVPNFRSYFDR